MKQPEHLEQHSRLLINSYFALTGKPLLDYLPEGEADEDVSDLVWHAPYAIVSHGVEEPPIFNYGNVLALQLFDYTWDEFTQLPSNKSAEASQQVIRLELLAMVTRCGFVHGYHGVRISKRGKRFQILDATIWNLVDQSGKHKGQAAVIRDYQPIK